MMTDSVNKSDDGAAETDANMPKFELVGPTADDDIRRAIYRYGIDAVVAAVKSAEKSKVGRPQVKDWPELRSVIQEDARDWLNGVDPFSKRSNYSIAKDFAEKHPGQSASSTHKRIARKLRTKPFDRKWRMLAHAYEMSRKEYSHLLHVKALQELARLDAHPVWKKSLESAESTIADFTAKNGNPPQSHLTMKEIEDGARITWQPHPSPRPMAGLLVNVPADPEPRPGED